MSFYLKKLLLLITLSIFIFNISAQENETILTNEENTEIVKTSENDFGYTWNGWLHENDGEKHYLCPAAWAILWDFGVLSFSRYITKEKWAQITLDDWKEVWKKDTEWDRDDFQTNCFLHPVQEGFVYATARASNLNFFESLLLATANSFLWEYFGETELPSRNDFVYSPLGAIPVGEVLYRLSCEADSVSGLLGIITCPTRLWTQAILRQKPLTTRNNIFELKVGLNIGLAHNYIDIKNNKIFNYDNTTYNPLIVMPSIYVSYNDPYYHDSNEPYSQFNFSGDLVFTPDKNEAQGVFFNYSIFSEGSLISRILDFGENKDTTISFELIYDYDGQKEYLISSLAPGIAFKQRINFENSKIEYQIHAAGIAMGASDSYYYKQNLIEHNPLEIRNYYFNVGFENILRFKFTTENKNSVFFDAHNYIVYDLPESLWPKNEKHKEKSQSAWELISLIKIGTELTLSKNFALSLQDAFFLKQEFGKDYEDYFHASQKVSTTFIYRFK